MMPSLASADLLALLAAIPAAALGGASFLKGVLGIAAWLRLPKLLVATTLAAFATSSPEMAVSSLAALSGKPEIALGNALGSNVVNAGLILGLALMFGALAARGDELRRDFVLALTVPILTLLLALDGVLSRVEGVLLLVLIACWLALAAREAVAHRRANTADAGLPINAWLAWTYLIAGLAALILAGQLFVTGASGMALALGVPPYLVGVTVVALGTSLPELVTVLLSRWQGHDDVGLGTLLGSNLFNGLAIVGLAAAIHPIETSWREVVLALGIGFLTVILMLPRGGTIPRRRGFALLVAYAVFVLATVGMPLNV